MTREDRIARNEVLYREVNERIKQVEETLTARGIAEHPGPGEYFCECGLEDCMEKVLLTPEEYEAVRASPIRFVITPDHVIADVELVVERNERFAVVEKHEGERELAAQRDPRTP